MATTHQIPLFEEKGDAIVSISRGIASVNDEASTYDLQAAVNFTDKFGVGVYSTDYYDERTYKGDDYTSHNYKEFSFILNPFEINGKERYEFMLSIGKGEAGDVKYPECVFCGIGSVPNPDPPKILEASYNKLSLQFNFGMKEKLIEGGLSFKMSYLDFYKLDRTEDYISSSESYKILFLEPAVFGRFGLPEAKIELQTGMTRALNKGDVNYYKYYISVGLRLQIDQVIKSLNRLSSSD